MASVRHQFSVNIADDASAQAAGQVLPSHWNQAHTLSGVATQADVDALSHAISVLSNQNSVEHANLSDRIDLGGGTASVTSDELSAVSAQAASALSQALSVLSVTDAGLSTRIDTVSQAHSVLSQAVSVISNTLSNEISVRAAASAALETHINTVSAGVNTVSNAVSNEISNRQSADNVVSNNASANALSIANVVSNQASVNDASIWSAVSVLRSAVSARSVGDVSTRGMQSIVNALSNRIAQGDSAVSQAASANAVSIANVVSAQAASALSQALSVLSVTDAALSVRVNSVESVLSQVRSAVSNVSATSAGGGSATGLQAAVDALSNKISTIAAGAQSVTSAEYVSTLSDVSHLRSIVSNVSAQSAGGSATGLQNVINMLSNKISQAGGGAGSVTSAEATASVRSWSANGSATASTKGFLQSVVNVISNTFSNAFSAGSAVSQRISVKAPWNQAKHMIVSNAQAINASTLTDISGLVVTVAADETWHVEGMLLLSTSAAGAGLKIGASCPPLSSPRMILIDSLSAGGQGSVAGLKAGGQLQVSGASTWLSQVSTNGMSVPAAIEFKAMFNVASAGTFRMMAAGIASTTASPINIMGGYMKCWRLK
jgi:hypothetical protein